jgi:hypothetical protein
MLVLPISSSAVTPWGSNWVWSLPLIVVTVVFHAYVLGLLNLGVSSVLRGTQRARLPRMLSIFVVGCSALCATILHSVDASIWAIAYCRLGALPDRKSAILYSLGAMTTYGKANLQLESRWQLMGSLEALDGWILFGLTAAFLFSVIQKVWSERSLHI